MPDPGGPISSRPCPPASAISSPRRASSWPRTSPRSGGGRPPAARRPRPRASSVGLVAGVDELDPRRRGRPSRRTADPDRARPPRRSVSTPDTSTPSTSRASSTAAAATTTRRRPRRASAATIGRTPGHRAHLAAERQLADERQPARPGADLLRAEQDAERHRQVERRAALAQVGRREVDRDPARRIAEPGVADARRGRARAPPGARCRPGRRS